MALQDEIVQIGKGFRDISDFSELIEKIKDKKIVMLGESTHGTHEFYEWRKRISCELLKNHDFNFIAVEGDWPSCEKVNQNIQGKDSSDVLKHFSRWPTWMWGNEEVQELMKDLKEVNRRRDKKIGFHGLDVYSLYESIDETINKLQTIDPETAAHAKRLYSCFEPYKHDERAYARSLVHMPEGCEEEVLYALSKILESNLKSHEYFDVVQNARIIKNAERYYRAMITYEDDSWNVRDKRMQETLDHLLTFYGPDAKAIVWAHNSHIGDYKATSMVNHGEINLGGLSREKYGEEQVALIGFATYTGDVIASHAWEGPIEVMSIPPGRKESLEDVLHKAVPYLGEKNYYLDFSLIKPDSEFLEVIGHRAIGVVYHPNHEHRGNYVPTIPAKRYDALIFFDETEALNPLDVQFKKEKIPETYPFGDQL
ncbi:MAG TPA: erythromycin esterase family protein [Bacteriovoracaceae bacterium]|nr:erythromycin esterase family protein [Bacteriovoracaceae bacterium]